LFAYLLARTSKVTCDRIAVDAPTVQAFGKSKTHHADRFTFGPAIRACNPCDGNSIVSFNGALEDAICHFNSCFLAHCAITLESLGRNTQICLFGLIAVGDIAPLKPLAGTRNMSQSRCQ